MLINDRLSVKKEIGKGSVGRVYKTIDLELKKYVALKVFDKRSSKVKYDKKGLANFNRLIKTEGEILRKFDHDHIIKCYGVYENPDFTILSTQYCNEGTLFEEITKRKVLYEEDAISIIKQITIGLAVFHPFYAGNPLQKHHPSRPQTREHLQAQWLLQDRGFWICKNRSLRRTNSHRFRHPMVCSTINSSSRTLKHEGRYLFPGGHILPTDLCDLWGWRSTEKGV